VVIHAGRTGRGETNFLEGHGLLGFSWELSLSPEGTAETSPGH
jgi:hypothetical protein